MKVLAGVRTCTLCTLLVHEVLAAVLYGANKERECHVMYATPPWPPQTPHPRVSASNFYSV